MADRKAAADGHGAPCDPRCGTRCIHPEGCVRLRPADGHARELIETLSDVLTGFTSYDSNQGPWRQADAILARAKEYLDAES